MIKIINQLDTNEDIGFNYSVDSTIKISEEADPSDCCEAFIKSMQVEGYLLSSILNAMYNTAKDWAFDYDIILKDNTEEEEERPRAEFIL